MIIDTLDNLGKYVALPSPVRKHSAIRPFAIFLLLNTMQRRTSRSTATLNLRLMSPWHQVSSPSSSHKMVMHPVSLRKRKSRKQYLK